MKNHRPGNVDGMKAVLESRLDILHRDAKRRRNAIWIVVVISILIIIFSTIVFVLWQNPYYAWFVSIIGIFVLIAGSQYPSYARYEILIHDIEAEIEMLSMSVISERELSRSIFNNHHHQPGQRYDHAPRFFPSKLIAGIVCILSGFLFIAVILYINT